MADYKTFKELAAQQRITFGSKEGRGTIEVELGGGLGSRPTAPNQATEAPQEEPTSFYERMYDSIASYFTDPEEADKVLLGTGQPEERQEPDSSVYELRPLEEVISMPSQTELAFGEDRSRPEVNVSRESLGFTREQLGRDEQGSLTESLVPRPRPEGLSESVIIPRLAENWGTGNVNAEDIRFLQTKLSEMQGGVPVDVGAIDGAWGVRGRNALWTFQQRNGLRPTGEMNEETARALQDSSNLTSESVDLSALESPSIRMLVGMEEFRVMPYIPMNRSGSAIGRSGLTFGAGIDVGQHTPEALKEKFGFTDEMIEELGVYDPETNPSGWIGRRPSGEPGTAERRASQAAIGAEYIRQRDAGELPVIDEQWMLNNTNRVYSQYVPEIESRYNSLFGAGEWDRLPEAAQAIPVLERYRGDQVSNNMLRALNSGNFREAANMINKASRRQTALSVLNSLPEEELQFKYFAPEESLVPRPRPNTQE